MTTGDYDLPVLEVLSKASFTEIAEKRHSLYRLIVRLSNILSTYNASNGLGLHEPMSCPIKELCLTSLYKGTYSTRASTHFELEL